MTTKCQKKSGTRRLHFQSFYKTRFQQSILPQPKTQNFSTPKPHTNSRKVKVTCRWVISQHHMLNRTFKDFQPHTIHNPKLIPTHNDLSQKYSSSIDNFFCGVSFQSIVEFKIYQIFYRETVESFRLHIVVEICL